MEAKSFFRIVGNPKKDWSEQQELQILQLPKPFAPNINSKI